MKKNKECVMYEKECTNCGECNICDLNPKKICNNCCKCIDSDSDFTGVYIDEIIEDDKDIEDISNEIFDDRIVEEYD